MIRSLKVYAAIGIVAFLAVLASCGVPRDTDSGAGETSAVDAGEATADEGEAAPDDTAPGDDPAGFDQEASTFSRRAVVPVPGVPGGTAAFPVAGVLPETVNPIAATDGTEQALQRLWHAALVRRDPLEDRWETWLAEGFRFTDEGILIQLRQDLTWSDGRPLTAPTWLRSVADYYLDPAMGGPWLEALAPSGYTIRWTAPADTALALTIEPYDQGAREVLLRAASVPPLPLHLLDPIRLRRGPRAVVDAGGLVSPDDREAGDPLPARRWAYSGPFVPGPLVGGRLRLVRNDSYGLTDAAGGALPYLESLDLVSIASAEAALDRFLAGELSAVALSPVATESDLRAGLDEARLDARLILGTRSPERLFYLGAGAPDTGAAAGSQGAAGAVTQGAPDTGAAAGAQGAAGAVTAGPAPPVLLVPAGVPVLAAIAPRVLPVGYDIEVVEPRDYLPRLLRPETRAAALVLLRAPDPPRPVELPKTGEPAVDLSELLLPRLLVRDGLENVVPDRWTRPLWTGTADRVFWRGGRTR